MRRTFALLTTAALAVSISCDKDTASATPEQTPAPSASAAEAGEAAPNQDAEADEKAKQEKQLAEAIASLEKQSKEKSERWTPELQSKITKLTSKNFKSTKSALKAILASDHRAPGNADRDKYRHPTKTLAFFGLKPDMKVFEIGQGAGWYTEILAPLLAKKGKLYLGGADPDSDDARQRYGRRATELFISSAGNLYESVEIVPQKGGDAPAKLGEPGSLDMVLIFRMMHNLHRFKLWDKYMPAVHAALKDGGVLAVVQHRAADDADPDESAKSGYMSQKWLVEKVEGYGFKLAKASDINANPKDTKDYPKGVWTLPPSLQLGETDKDKYMAIGESDRSTLKFVKLAK